MFFKELSGTFDIRHVPPDSLATEMRLYSSDHSPRVKEAHHAQHFDPLRCHLADAAVRAGCRPRPARAAGVDGKDPIRPSAIVLQCPDVAGRETAGSGRRTRLVSPGQVASRPSAGKDENRRRTRTAGPGPGSRVRCAGVPDDRRARLSGPGQTVPRSQRRLLRTVLRATEIRQLVFHVAGTCPATTRGFTA